MDYVIAEKDISPQLALTYRQPVTMATIADRIGGAFGRSSSTPPGPAPSSAGPPFILYPEDCGDEFVMTVCMPVVPGATGGEQVALEEVPGGTVASTVHVGPYNGVGKAYVALQKWMTDNGRRPAGWCARSTSTIRTPCREELLTEIDWPIA